MSVTPTYKFILPGGGIVWDLGSAAGAVELTGWQYTDALSEAQEGLSAGMADPQGELERQLQGRQPPAWQFPPLWRSFIDAAEREAHLVPPDLLRSALRGTTAAGGLLLSQPVAAAAVDLIAAGGLFAAGSSGEDGSPKEVSLPIKPPATSASSLTVAKGIRNEVLAASARFVKADTKNGFLDGKKIVHHSTSQLRGTEHLLLPFDQAAGRVVLSLGSGPDVFRPIFNFPLAAEYHLLDTLRSWGTLPQHALDQLFWRLRTLSADEGVKLLDKGFLGYIPESTIANRDLFAAFLREHPDERQPIVIEVPVNTGTGTMVKRFYFHPQDYNDERGVTAMHNATLSGKSVGAIMVTGVRWSMKTMDHWLKRLEDDAVLINEGFVWKGSFDSQGDLDLQMGRSFVYRDRKDARQDLRLKELEDRYRNEFTVQFGAPARENSITPEIPKSNSLPFHVPIIFRPRSKEPPNIKKGLVSSTDFGANTVGLFNLEMIVDLLRPVGEFLVRAAKKVFRTPMPEQNQTKQNKQGPALTIPSEITPPSVVEPRPQDSPAPVDVATTTEALRVMKDAGLVGEHGRLRDVNVNEALKLIELAASHGGLLSLFAHGGYSMPTEEDSVDAHPLFGRTQLAEFIFERKKIAENGNAISELVPLYVQHLRKAANHLYILSWTGDVIGAVNSSTSPSLAYLSIIMETLCGESADIISELLHHAPVADLNIVRDGIARKLGTDPSKWQEAVDAHSERDSGMSIHLGGIAKWRGETERPALDLSHDIKLGGRTLHWADHPLFSGGASLDPPKLGGAAFLEEGFTSAELPGGLNIHWRYQLNTETQVPEIVFTGNDSAVAFVLQYLVAANGGTNVSGFDTDFFFPFNKALNYVARVVEPSRHVGFSNASGVFIRFNPSTLMHEAVYTRERERHYPGTRPVNVGFIKPEQLLSAWQFVLKEAAASKRPIEFLEDADPNPASILQAMQNVLRLISPDLAERLHSSLSGTEQALAKATLPKNVWHARVGVLIDPDDGIAKPTIRLFANKRPGQWGSISGLIEGSDETLLIGTPGQDGKVLWTVSARGRNAKDAPAINDAGQKLIGGLGKDHWLAPLSPTTLASSLPPSDSIEGLPVISNANDLPIAELPSIKTADSAGPLEPFVPATEKFAGVILKYLPVTAEQMDLLLTYGGTLSDKELGRIFPNPVRQTWQTIAWAKRLISRYPHPWQKNTIRQDIEGVSVLAPDRRRLESVIPRLMSFENNDPEPARKEIKRHILIDLGTFFRRGDERVRKAFVDRERLALAATDIGVEILSGLAQELGQQAINIYQGTYSFSPRTTHDEPVTKWAMRAVESESRLTRVRRLFELQTGIKEDLPFLQFLEFEVGIRFDLSASFAMPIDKEWLKWVALRDAALWAVPNKEAVLGDRLKDYQLVHDAILILTGRKPTPPGAMKLVR